MLKNFLELERIQLLGKKEQKAIRGGDSAFLGFPCQTDEDCCDSTAESLFGGSVCALAGSVNGFCVPS